MSTPARIQKALSALEARRVAIEQRIINDMERKFFSDPADEILAVCATDVLPTRGLTLAAPDGITTNVGHSVMIWIA
jgi:hypothetical protein